MSRPSLLTTSVLLGILGLLLLYGGAPLWLAVLCAPIALGVLCRMTIPERLLIAALSLVITLYPIYIGVVQIAYWRAGAQGIDFGIFSQLIYQVATNDEFVTSLIDTSWQNFITHHFSPFLIIAGAIAKVGISSEAVLIGIHVAAVTALILGLKALWRTAGAGSGALILTATTLLLPGVRRALGWETHDEVLALPFIVWSLVAHLRGRDTFKLVILLPTLLLKETFGLVLAATALSYTLHGGIAQDGGGRTNKRLAILFACGGMLFFLVVTRVLPEWLWTSTFDPSGRIASVTELLSLDLLLAKAGWAAMICAPASPFLALHSRSTLRQSVALAGPALYSLAAIAITNFPAMLDPYCYYAMVPTITLFCAASVPVASHPRMPIATLLSLSIALLLGNTVQSMAIYRAGFLDPSAYAELREVIPQRSSVIVDDYTASVLSDNEKLLRIFHARRSHPTFDFIVTKKPLESWLSEQLRRRSAPCHETRRYLVRCARSRSK